MINYKLYIPPDNKHIFRCEIYNDDIFQRSIEYHIIDPSLTNEMNMVIIIDKISRDLCLPKEKLEYPLRQLFLFGEYSFS